MVSVDLYQLHGVEEKKRQVLTILQSLWILPEKLSLAINITDDEEVRVK